MSGSVPFRYAWLTGLLLLLVLAACEGAIATPEVAIPEPYTQSPPTAEASLPAAPSPTSPTPGTAAHPTEVPPSPTPSTAPTSELPFPALIRTIDFGVAAGNLAELKVGGGRLYLTDSGGILHILDTATYEELAALPVSGELVPEPVLDRLYAISQESVTVVDTAALTVTGILTPGGSVGWDPKRNRLYVGDLYHGALVYDALTLEKLREMPVGGKVVYNPLRDELLVVALTVYRVDPETLELLGDLLPNISAGERACSGCTGMPFAYDAQVLADLNRLVVKLDWHGKWGGGCGPAQSVFDATTLEPVQLSAEPISQPTCSGQRTLPGAIRDRVYQGLRCGWVGGSYRNLLVYDLQGKLLTWRDGVGAELVNPNTCQSYQDWGDRVRVIDLPTLTPAGDLPQGNYTLNAPAGRLYATAGSVLRIYAEQGGRPDPPEPPSEAGPLPDGAVTWIEASPGFRRDQTLFAGLGSDIGRPKEVYRSADGGATWVRLRGGLPEGDSVRLSLAVSPGFASDRTLFAGGQRSTWAGEGVWRSTDGGDTWRPIWDDLEHLSVQSIALSPRYADDGTLLAYSEFHDLFNPAESLSHTSVSRSTDRGLHWTLVATGTLLPPEELLPADPRSPGLRFRTGTLGWVDRWTAEVGAWQPVFRVPGQDTQVRAVVPSPDVASDGTVYVLSQAGLFRSENRGESWAHCPEGRLDGRDYTKEALTACWAGDQLAVGTANGEVLFVDPAGLECEPIGEVSPWPAVLAGTRVAGIVAEPRSSPGSSEGAGVWLGNRLLYRCASNEVQTRCAVGEVPPGDVLAMAVTSDSGLWVGGRGDPTAASFDGQAWTPHPLPEIEGSGWVQGLAAGTDGTVWAVTAPPGVYRWTGTAWERLADPQGRLGERVHAIAIALDGSPWVATGRGLAHYVRGVWTSYDVGACAAVAVGASGEVYGLAPLDLDAVIWRFAAGVWTTLPPAGPEFVGASTLCAARDGSLWVGTARGAFRYDGQEWRQFPGNSPLPGDDVGAIAEDSDGVLWFGTNNGAAHADPEELDLSAVSWPAPVPVPFPTAKVTPSPTPEPSATPTPVEAPPVAEPFASAYADAWLAIRLGPPREEAGTTQAVFQAFEHGLMIWRADTVQIYVLHDGGSLAYYSETWDESQPADDPGRVPPAGLYQPVRGFGLLWRTQAAVAELGWALAPEQGYEMLLQRFEGGTMLLGPQGEMYVLLPFWSWERR